MAQSIFFCLIGVLLIQSCANCRAEDWTTTDGKTYQDIKVVRVEEDAVTILDKDGGARIDLALLPTNLQKRFNYDPEKARIAIDQRTEEAKKQEQQLLINKAIKENKISLRLIISQVVPGGFIGCTLKPVITNPPLVSVTTISFEKSDVEVFVACDNSHIADGDDWQGDVWEVGNYSFTTIAGAERTLRRYTANASEYAESLQIK